MKVKRYLLLSVFATLAIFASILYTACNKNKCSNVTCLNKGTCYSGTCVCPIGFEGPRCETLSRDKFLFNYNGYDACGDSNKITRYSIQFVAVLHDSTEMVISNFRNFSSDSVICTIVAPDSFLLLGSTNGTNFTGGGHLSNDSLRMFYHVVHDTTQYDCAFYGESLRH